MRFVNGATCWLSIFAKNVVEIKNSHPAFSTGDGTDITKYVSSCSLSFDWDSDTQVSGSMELNGVNPYDYRHSRISIYYNQSVDGSIESTFIAEMYVDEYESVFTNGQWSGNVSLVSRIGFLSRTVCGQNFGGKSITRTLAGARYVNTWGAGSSLNPSFGYVSIDIASNAVDDDVAIDNKFDTSLVELLKSLEGVNKHNHLSVYPGRQITLEKAPSSSDPFEEFISTEDAIVIDSVVLKYGEYEMYNRVAHLQEARKLVNLNKSQTYIATAVCSNTIDRSFNKSGRYVDYAVAEYFEDETGIVQSNAKANAIMSSIVTLGAREWMIRGNWHGVMTGRNMRVTLRQVKANGSFLDTVVSGLNVGLDITMQENSLDIATRVREW